MCLLGSGNEGLQEMRNSMSILHVVRLNGVSGHCTKTWNCQSVQTCFSSRYEMSLRNARCINDDFLAYFALQVMLTAVPSVKMKPENTEMQLVFMWLVSDTTMLLPSELSLLHRLFTVCCVGYNILVKYTFLLIPT